MICEKPLWVWGHRGLDVGASGHVWERLKMVETTPRPFLELLLSFECLHPKESGRVHLCGKWFPQDQEGSRAREALPTHLVVD